MLVARIENEVVVELGQLSEMYPSTSFSEQGPDPEFMTLHSLRFVDNNLSMNPETQKMTTVEPYLDAGVVRTVLIETMSPEEIEERRVSRINHRSQIFMNEAQKRLDDFAKTRGYDSIFTVCTYKDSTVPRFHDDAIRAMSLRDQWWFILGNIANEVLQGTRAEPESFEDFVSELPALTWS